MPNLYIIGGCNGAGKTTIAYTVLPEVLHCREFVNADTIAAGLSPLNPEGIAPEADKLMQERITRLLKERRDVAFETNFANRHYIPLIRTAKKEGYEVMLIYLWLDSPEFAMKRVEERVQKGGHAVPEEITERSYYWGIHNLINLYAPLADYWFIIDNRSLAPRLITHHGIEEEEPFRGFESGENPNPPDKPENKKKKEDVLADRILAGIKQALRRLAETSASVNGELVVADKDGVVKSLPAKKLLQQLHKEG